ncbi:MAG: SpoIID/LytB domain-containing protein, partial [Elusimicrobiota bacterium]
KKGYDLRDDAFSQIYDGQNTDSERIRRAVRETAGQVLVYDGKLLPGYFHSTCAGRTTSPGSVWGSSAPTPKPLRGVRDRWCKISPHYKWTAYFRTADILKNLQRKGINALRISRIRPGLRDAGGFLRTLDLMTEGGWRGLRTHAFRIWMGAAELKSTKIRRIVRRRKGFHFIGRGYGHGVGLCQWGARGQAERGRGYRRILRHYFPGAKIRLADPGWLSRLEP